MPSSDTAQAVSRTTTTELRKVLEFWTTDIPHEHLGKHM